MYAYTGVQENQQTVEILHPRARKSLNGSLYLRQEDRTIKSHDRGLAEDADRSR